MITKHGFIVEKLGAKKLVTFSGAHLHELKRQLCSSLKLRASYIKLKIEYSSAGAPITLATLFSNFWPQKVKLKANSILKLRRICCVRQADLNRLEKLFNDFSGVSLVTKKASSRSSLVVLTNASCALLPCKNSGAVKILNVFPGSSNASEGNGFVLRLSSCLNKHRSR